MARPRAYVTVQNMLSVMRLVNELAPDDPTCEGEPIPVSTIARTLGLTSAETRRYISMLNDCGDSLRGYFISYDRATDSVTPWKMGIALDQSIGLTPLEATALLMALDAMGLSDDSDLRKKLSDAIPPLTAEVVSSIEISTRGSESPEVLATLTNAITTSQVVRLEYCGRGDVAPRMRDVEPLRLVYDLDELCWYLHAWCRQADGWRIFRCSRITSAQATGDVFLPRMDPSGSSSPRDSLAEAPLAKLLVHDPEFVRLAGDWKGMAPIDGPSAGDGGAYFASIPWLQGYPWLARKIVASRGKVEAIEPEELREEVRDISARALALLDGTREQG